MVRNRGVRAQQLIAWAVGFWVLTAAAGSPVKLMAQLPSNSNTCRLNNGGGPFLAPSGGTVGDDGKRHFKIGIGYLSSDMQQAARDAIDMINGFTSTTSIVLDPATTSSGGESNIYVTSDSNEAGGMAKFYQGWNGIAVLDSAADLAGVLEMGMARMLGHELLHFLGVDENNFGNQATLMKQCTSTDPATCLEQYEANGGMQQKDADMVPYCFAHADEEYYDRPADGGGDSQPPYEDHWSSDPEDFVCYTVIITVDTYRCYGTNCTWIGSYEYVGDHWCEPLQNALMTRLRRPHPLFTPANFAFTSADQFMSFSQTCGRQ